MKVNNPLMFHAEMMLVYKGSNQVIHNTADRMTHQRINLIRNIKINNDETLEWCLHFKILDVTLLFVLFGQKVYQEIEENGEKMYVHLTNSYFYFHEIPDEKKIVIHGYFIYNKEYTEKCIIDERFKYQVLLLKDKFITDVLETSKRMKDEVNGNINM